MLHITANYVKNSSARIGSPVYRDNPDMVGRECPVVSRSLDANDGEQRLSISFVIVFIDHHKAKIVTLISI